jgi:pimeloyl-ACP methyl ester carboxylesterase
MHRDGPRSGAMSFLFSVLLGLALASACWAQDNAGPNAGQEQAGKAVGGPVASPIAACNEASASALDAGFGLRCGTSIPAGIFLGSYLAATIDSIGDCVKRCVGNESCTAFSLSAHEASLGAEKPSAPLCTLYGSAERFIDEANSVAGVRVSGAVDDSGGSGGGGRHHYHAHRRASAPRKGSKSASQPGSDDAKVELTPDMTALQPVYFATDRVPATGAPLEASFTAGRASKISYGLSVVSIPKNHTVGNVERPKFSYLKWRYQAETDADHFRIKALTPLDHDALVSELAGGDDSVLLFVHGYNVTFADAIYEAAQIAYDANFPGSVLAFSWPSAGALLKYDEDRESAEFAAPDLGQILQMLSAEIGDKKVYIVAHSMGNQVLVGALQQAALSKTDLTINELVMAAPDVDKDVFSRKAEHIREQQRRAGGSRTPDPLGEPSRARYPHANAGLDAGQGASEILALSLKGLSARLCPAPFFGWDHKPGSTGSSSSCSSHLALSFARYVTSSAIAEFSACLGGRTASSGIRPNASARSDVIKCGLSGRSTIRSIVRKIQVPSGSISDQWKNGISAGSVRARNRRASCVAKEGYPPT